MSVIETRRRSTQQTTPPGTGELHQALEDASDATRLHAFCELVECSAEQASADGKRLSLLRVLDLMRGRGYGVTEPAKAPHQPRRNFTTWIVVVTFQNKTTVQLAFATPDASTP